MTQNEVQAVIKTVYMVVTMVIVAFFSYITFSVIPNEYLPYIAIGCVAAYLLYMLYSINLAQIKYNETLKNLNETPKKVDK